jgi:crossover junction endodeoxyribonuclease RusA
VIAICEQFAGDFVPLSGAFTVLPFEMIVDGPPVSQQTRNRSRLREWQKVVRQAAEKWWPPGAPPASGDVEVKVTYFYESASPDVDNIVKPIQDALKELVFEDDDQVVNVLCRKRKIDGNFRIRHVSRVLAEGFINGKEFLYVLVARPSDMEALR